MPVICGYIAHLQWLDSGDSGCTCTACTMMRNEFKHSRLPSQRLPRPRHTLFAAHRVFDCALEVIPIGGVTQPLFM
jgi:hypothetical protein